MAEKRSNETIQRFLKVAVEACLQNKPFDVVQLRGGVLENVEVKQLDVLAHYFPKINIA